MRVIVRVFPNVRFEFTGTKDIYDVYVLYISLTAESVDCAVSCIGFLPRLPLETRDFLVIHLGSVFSFIYPLTEIPSIRTPLWQKFKD